MPFKNDHYTPLLPTLVAMWSKASLYQETGQGDRVSNRIQGQSGVQNQNRNFKASKRLYKCNYCKKLGHKAADCWTKMANEKQVSMASEQTHAAAEEIVTLTSSSVSTLCAKLTRRDDVWCVDSGATTHMCRDKNSFLELTPTINPISNADGHVDKVQESDPIDPDRPIEVNENYLKSENLSKDCTVIENKRGPGRPKLIKTGKPGRPAKHFNLVTPKPEKAKLKLIFVLKLRTPLECILYFKNRWKLNIKLKNKNINLREENP
uniref:CCHC-type domain-containing protein n=1 Tax=Timema shepardi TaxID=629360 RepID=A0A7R9AX79_TIMSH|nr:unnamed protein product [Timema shepardi]